MKRTLGRVASAALTLSLAAAPAAAQMVGNPVYFSPKGGIGFTISGDYGRGLNDESGKSNYFGGRATLGLPMVSIMAGAGSVKPEAGESDITFGGAIAVNVLKVGPVTPVALSLQAGVGYQKIDVGAISFTTLNVPIGVGITVDVPTPAVGVEPWVAPRINIVRVSALGASSTETGFGASGGLNITLPTGLGFHVAFDWMTIGDPSVKPLTVGAGIHYTISIPSLGVPGVPGM